MSEQFLVLNECEHDFTSNSFYCYVLMNPQTNVPFYVGKGKFLRYEDHQYRDKNLLKYNTFNKIIKECGNVAVKIVHSSYDEVEVLEFEENLIKHYGKIIEGSGTLTNIQDGGSSPPNQPLKPVNQFNVYGEYIKTFESTADAARYVLPNNYKKAQSIIRACCSGKSTTFLGSYWADVGKPILKYNVGKSQPVVQYAKNMSFIKRYEKISTASQETGLYHKGILYAIQRNGTCGGFRWKFYKFPSSLEGVSANQGRSLRRFL